MKKFIKVSVIIIAILFVGNFLLNRFFFRTNLDREPEIIKLNDTVFNFSSTKSFYFKVDKNLFYAQKGELSNDLKPIWKGQIEETFISPNSQYILIYFDKKLILINCKGQILFNIDNCTDQYAVDDRISGRFVSMDVQWNKNSDFFLIAQDRVWDKNFSKKNKSSIYKYSIKDNSFSSFIDLDDELQDDFCLSPNENYLYYQFATAKGDFAFKKVDIQNNKIISEFFRNDCYDSIFINYNDFKKYFDGNSYDIQRIITVANAPDGRGLYLKDKDTTLCLMVFSEGYNAFKGLGYDCFNNGYFLPGNKYFIANIDTKNFRGQLVIDTKTFQIMKLKKQTEFYFNINSNDCGKFVFRHTIFPYVKVATHESIEIERQNKTEKL
jgi:hypothetical protein